MQDERSMPKELTKKYSFSRKEFVSAMKSEYGISEPQIAYDLQKRLDMGRLIHVGWNKYIPAGDKQIYTHKYSNAAEEIVKKITEQYLDLNFQVFELIQLNDFMNHQIAHNTIFVTIENDLQDFVFDTLKGKYPGRVMFKPKIEEYYRYLQDDQIVVGRLPSESPKGFDKPWKSRLEKIIVDVFTDKLISRIVPEGEKDAIISGAFDSFLLDEKIMLRYAKRKGVDTRFRKILMQYGVTNL